MTNKTVTLPREPVAWANWKVGTKSYVPYRTLEEAQASVSSSEIAATQLGPYKVVPLYAAALAEPVPPAGGEVEVVTAAWLDLSKLDKGSMAYATAMKVNHRQTELVDRAHVTRLQAEVERLNSELTLHHSHCSGAYSAVLKQNDALQSELTKAREELEEWKRGSRAEAQAGDEARAEVGRLRAELSTANDKLRRQDIASQYKDGRLSKHDGELAMLQAELNKARELLKEALCDLPYSFARHNIEAYFAHQSAPAAKCSTCDGSGTIDAGEITCSDGGIPFENGPVKCLKDCPECAPAAKDEVYPTAEIAAEAALGLYDIDFPSPDDEQEQPAPIAAVDLTELREYHVKGVKDLNHYADASGLRESDVKHYRKRAEFHRRQVALLDSLK